MSGTNSLSLILGLVLFSFSFTSVLIVPFIDILYKLKFLRFKEAPKLGKVPLIDKLLDKKAGVPTGGGILLVAIVTLLFLILIRILSQPLLGDFHIDFYIYIFCSIGLI